MKPETEQPSDIMPRTATKKAKEDEKTSFHQDAFKVAGGVETPKVKGSDADSWKIKGPGKRNSICTELTSPKGVANLMGLHNPTPPQTNSDTGSGGSKSSNRFSALGEEEDGDATTDVVPIE